MRTHLHLRKPFRSAAIVALAAAVCAIAILWWRDRGHLFATADQRGQRLMERGEFGAAADVFADPNRKAVALFRAGDFERAASIFQSLPGAEACFNHGNALVMLGEYEQAAMRFERALQLRPGWEAAETNRAIALARAELLKAEGGEGTGGKLGADEIVFNDNPSRKGGGDEVTSDEEGSAGGEAQEMWLRQVQTTPSQFLRAKFSYQVANRQREQTDAP